VYLDRGLRGSGYDTNLTKLLRGDDAKYLAARAQAFARKPDLAKIVDWILLFDEYVESQNAKGEREDAPQESQEDSRNQEIAGLLAKELGFTAFHTRYGWHALFRDPSEEQRFGEYLLSVSDSSDEQGRFFIRIKRENLSKAGFGELSEKVRRSMESKGAGLLISSQDGRMVFAHDQ
jgi:hypothetical protein